jgi:multicomponent Na+:H+ antiporter subunit A
VHGLVLGLSLVSLTAGSLAYAALARHPGVIDRVSAAVGRVSAERAYDRALEAVQAVATGSTAVLQSGILRRYVAITIAFAVAVAGTPAAVDLVRHPPAMLDVLRWYEALLIALVAGGAIATAVSRDRVSTIAAIGTSGIAISFLFALFSAPDLAITQIMVETLLVILLVLVFRKLPPSVKRSRQPVRIIHAALAGVAGITVMLLLMLTTSATPHSRDAAEYFTDRATQQHSSNVVNAILVNFRSLDTLGEIMVLATAGIGVLALLRLAPSKDTE